MTVDLALPVAADVVAAADRIAPYARRTPVLRTEIDGRLLVLKLEYLQLSGSFKLRGALNVMLAGDRPAEVVTASGGNHGAGVATAARLLGIPATVYVPESVPADKARRIVAAGARLVRSGAVYAEAAHSAKGHAAESGARYLEAYDDPFVVAGQGTAAAEALHDIPEIDVIAVAAGGGGLAAGTALAAGGRLTVTVEPEHCRCVHNALAAGGPVDSAVDSIAASALGATRMGRIPYQVLADRPTESVLVSDADLLAARDRLWEDLRIAVEVAAAAPYAAWLAGLVPGELPCIVLCGANAGWTSVD